MARFHIKRAIELDSFPTKSKKLRDLCTEYAKDSWEEKVKGRKIEESFILRGNGKGNTVGMAPLKVASNYRQ